MATEESKLILTADATSVPKATAQLDALTASSTRAEAAANKLAASEGKVAAATAERASGESLTAKRAMENATASTAAARAIEAEAAAQVKLAASTNASAAAQVRQMGSAIGSALGGNGALTGVASRAALGALGGLGLGLGSVVAFLATMGASYAMAAHESDQFTRALISTGTASTTTTADLRDMAQQVGAQTDSYGKAEKAMLALAQTGAYSREQLGGLTETAVQLAQMTGGDVATSVKFVNTLMGANAKAIAALDMQYHFLTASQLEHIRKLDDEGNADQAQAVAMRAASQAVRDRANEVKESVSIMSKAWSGLTGVVSEAWNAMKQSAGPQTLNMQLATAQKALDAAKGTHFSANSQQLVPNASPAEIAKLQGDVNTLRAQVVQQGIQQTQAAVNANAETRAKAGNAYLDQFKTPQQTYNDDLSKAANARQNALLAPNLTTEERANIEAKYQRAAAVALQTYNSSLSAGAHGGGAGTPADPLSGLSSMVTGLSTKSIGVAGDQALTTYVQGVAKLLDEFDSATAKGANVTRATELYDQGLQSLNQTLNATRVAQAAADKAYGEQLDQQLATRRAAIALQVQSVGMGDKEVERMQQLNSVYQEFDRQLAQLNRQRDAGSISVDQYANRLAKLRKNETDTVAALNDGFAQMDHAQAEWVNGFTQALANLKNQSANVAGQVNGLFTDAFSGMGDAIANFVTTGKLNFASLADSVISDLARMETRILLSQALTSIFGGMQLTSIGNNYMAGGGASYAASGVNWGVTLAKGGVYDSPSLSRYSSGVYDTPHYFAFANGGVFGEAGPEAVMPLTRTSDGKLGVKSAGGSNVVVNITNQGQPVQAKQTGTRQQGNTTIIDMVLTAVATDVNQGGKTAQAFQQRFGLARRGVPV